MRLIKLNQGRFKVAAVVEEGEVPVLRFLRELPADMQGSANGMPALFQRYAESGRRQLSSAAFHEANKQEGIWQFIKGRLRIFCFMDADGTLLVLSHGAVKKTQKADTSEVAKAVRLKEAYLAARKQAVLEWEE